MLLLNSCSQKINPPAPAEYYDRSTIEEVKSVINIPVTFSLDEVENKINNHVKGVLYEDKITEEDNLLIRVTKKDNIKLDVKNNLVFIKVPVNIYAKAGINISQFGLNISHYDDTEFSLVINYVTKITVNNNWQINTLTHSNGFNWIKKPEIKLGPVKIPVSSMVANIIDKQQKKIAGQMDRQIAKNISIKKYIDQAWDFIIEPRKISDQLNAWLKIEPREVYLSPLKEENGLLKISLGVKGNIQTIIGKKPFEEKIALPPLKSVKNIKDSFKIKLPGSISYNKANEFLKEYFKGKTYTFKNNKKQITIKNIGVYGQGGKLVVKTRIAGDINGNIYFKGSPYIDHQRDEIRIRQLDFHIDTRNQLINTAAWLAKGTFTKKIINEFRIPYKQELDSLKKEVQKYITDYTINDYLLLRGNMESIKPKKIMIMPEYFVIEIDAKGSLMLHLSGI